MILKKHALFLAGLLCLVITPAQVDAQSGESPADEITRLLGGVEISGQWFLAYDVEQNIDDTRNEFNLKRGYITFRKDLNDHLSARFTQDITVDQEGDGEGDIEIRLKYAYLKYNTRSRGLFTDASVEFGVVHRPWIDFEQGVNAYRVQGSMYLERVGAARSADYGLTFFTLFGGKMDSDYTENVNSKYPGRYGSIAVGVFNGGGYESIEKNENKLVEGRLSLRPFPDFIPGLQFSAAGNYGKGNTPEAPDLRFVSGFVSWETKRSVVTGMYYEGTGNTLGTLVNSQNRSIDQRGYSAFAEAKFLERRFSLIGRYDLLDRLSAPGSWYQQRFIGGVAWHFFKNSKILVDYEYNKINEGGGRDFSRYELAVEIRF